MGFFEIKRPDNFDIVQIFDCGQCFRFSAANKESDTVTYEGVAFDRHIKIVQTADSVSFYNTEKSEFESVWSRFLDLGTDYGSIIESFSDDNVLYEAANFADGIRILKQDKWEALCSFIISQNNNIPRIKGIIENMSARFGKEIYRDGERAYYSFPTAKALYDAGEDEIFSLKTGFRAKYIFDAAKRVCENPFFLTEVSGLDTEEASEKLQVIKGVGKKVAACTLLFGFERYDCFPVDVWVKRILDTYYPNGGSRHFDGKYAGVAQQYLFYYERCKNKVFLS